MLYDTKTKLISDGDGKQLEHKTKGDPVDTFLVFYSGQCNVSGRYTESKKKNIEFFIDFISKNRSVVEETLVANNNVVLEWG
jgi:hypothetical protein